MTPAGTSNELDVQNEWEENTHTHTHAGDARIVAVTTKQPEALDFSLRSEGNCASSLAYDYVSLVESVLRASGSYYCVTTITRNHRATSFFVGGGARRQEKPCYCSGRL